MSTMKLRSISYKLLTPIIIGSIALIIAFSYTLKENTDTLIENRLQSRALEIAESLTLAIESNSEMSNIIRVIYSLGSYDEIEQIYLVDIKTRQILASSMNMYTRKPLASLSDESKRRHISAALEASRQGFIPGSESQGSFYYHFDIITPDRTATKSVLLFFDVNTGAVAMHYASFRFSVVIYFLVILTTGSTLFYLLTKRIIVKPIRNLESAVKKGEINQHLSSDKSLGDEIDRLGENYNRLITSLNEKQQQLIAEKEKSEQASHAKSEFLAVMTHEIRTPLNSVLGLTELLIKRSKEEEQRELLTLVNESGQQLMNIVNNVLDFSKIEAGKLELNQTPFHPEDIITRLTKNFHKQADEKKLALNFINKVGKSPLIEGDVFRIQQILTNLLSNALKFTQEGFINITLEESAPEDDYFYYIISVTDSGIGLDSDAAERLFEKFTQGDNSTTRKFGGTGLGLAICKTLVEKMEGNITVTGHPGKGSCFSVALKGKVLELRETFNERDNLTHDDKKTSVILIVDDTEINCVVLKAQLSDEPWTLISVNAAKEALDIFQQRKIDLILMDCLMPEMDGFTAAKHIRNMEQQGDAHVPIIAITASALKSTESKCKESGMDDYLTKPVSQDILKHTIKKWLPGQQITS